MWRMKQNFVAQFFPLLKHWLRYMWSRVVVEKNWDLSVDQCWLQALQFLVHLIDLLSILLRCNGFAGIQKAAMDQISSRPANSDDDHFLVQVWLQEVLCSLFLVQSLRWSLSVIVQNPLSSHVTIRLRNGSLLLHRTREENTSKL